MISILLGRKLSSWLLGDEIPELRGLPFELAGLVGVTQNTILLSILHISLAILASDHGGHCIDTNLGHVGCVCSKSLVWKYVSCYFFGPKYSFTHLLEMEELQLFPGKDILLQCLKRLRYLYFC